MQSGDTLNGKGKRAGDRMYNVGMYGGSFDPLHMGHVRIITEATSVCKELHLILSHSKIRDRIDYKQRYQWLVQITKDMPNIIIHAIEDKSSTKEEYNWEDGANNIKAAIGKNIDVVFCGGDYETKGTFNGLYGNSDIIYTSRNLTSISSTEIHKNPYKNWEYIPNIVKQYYIKKILIVGSESCGKSTLVKKLALYYNTTYVKEMGRDICERAQVEDMMLESDFYEIMIRHKELEYKQLEHANKLLFIDTDCVTTAFYAELLCESESRVFDYTVLAGIMSRLNYYDLVLFLEHDVELVQDGTRNENIAKNREYFSSKLNQTLIEQGIKTINIYGDYNIKMKTAITEINSLLGGSKDD